MAVKLPKVRGAVPQSIGSWIQPRAVTAKTTKTGAWPSMGKTLAPPPVTRPVITDEGLFEPGDEPGLGPVTDPTGLDPNYPGAPAAGAGIGTNVRVVPAHWSNPNWEALMRGDPRFIAGQAANTANKASAATKRATAIKNAIIAFGGVPKNWASGFGDLTEADMAKAGANPYSFMALANAQRGKSRADLQAELAGRGILDSGALTGGENMVQGAFDQGVAGGETSLLGLLGGAETTWGTDVTGLDRDWLNQQATIGAGIQAANPNQWIEQYEEPV